MIGTRTRIPRAVGTLDPYPAAPGGELTSLAVSTTTAPDDRQGYENFLGSATAPTVIGGGATCGVTKSTPSPARPLSAGELETRQMGACRPACATAMSKPRSTTGTRQWRRQWQREFQQDDPGRRRHLRAESRSTSTPVRQGYETPTLGEMVYSGTAAPASTSAQAVDQYPVRIRRQGFRRRLHPAQRRGFPDQYGMTKSSRPAPPVAAPYYTNAASTLRQGLEVAVDSGVFTAMARQIAFTHMHAPSMMPATAASMTARLPAIPGHQCLWRTRLAAPSGLSTALEAVHRSRVFVNDANDEQVALSYTLFNLRVAATQTQGRGSSSRCCASTTCSTAPMSAR